MIYFKHIIIYPSYNITILYNLRYFMNTNVFGVQKQMVQLCFIRKQMVTG